MISPIMIQELQQFGLEQIDDFGQKPIIQIEQISELKPIIQKPQINLADRDKYLNQIERQIAAKQQLLINKRSYLEKTLKENAFLEGVKNDYNKYRNYIVKEKEEQLRAMNILKKYTEDLAVNTDMTNVNIKETKRDQKSILREIAKIKKELDDIITPVVY